MYALFTLMTLSALGYLILFVLIKGHTRILIDVPTPKIISLEKNSRKLAIFCLIFSWILGIVLNADGGLIFLQSFLIALLFITIYSVARMERELRDKIKLETDILRAKWRSSKLGEGYISEKDIQKIFYNAPELIEDGLKIIREEYHCGDVGYIDLLGIDNMEIMW